MLAEGALSCFGGRHHQSRAFYRIPGRLDPVMRYKAVRLKRCCVGQKRNSDLRPLTLIGALS
jgi:hypothetical protein